MAKEKINDPSILEAVDNLSSMAELDIEEVKVDKKGEKSPRVNMLRWLDPADERKTIAAVKANLKVVYNYLKHLYQKESKQLKDKSMQKGVSAIMSLAIEAVERVDFYAKQCKKKINITNSKEYVSLIEFYEKKIQSRFDIDVQEGDEEEESAEDSLDVKRRGLKDLESVTRDNDYELFYLQKENGGKFYNVNLARHIRLVADFDQILAGFAALDPFTRVPIFKDDVAYHLCRQIRASLKKELDVTLKGAGKYRDDPLVQNIFKATMALLLGSNAKNQLKITTGKSAFSYFKDFQNNLRLVLTSIDYRNYLDNPPEEEFYINLMDLLHKFSYVIYTSRIYSEEAVALLSTMIGEGKDEKSERKSKRSSTSMWNTLIDDYDILSAAFSKCPNGPLFKVLDIVTAGDNFAEFDPYLQEDLPGKYYTLTYYKHHVDFLKVPSPTMQTNIDEANISFEFMGFLRVLAASQKTLLLFNFQDRTSWKESARSRKIEALATDGEVGCATTVITLPKSTDFYSQSDEYLKVEDAKDFKEVFLKQLESEGECGYRFPKSMDRKKFLSFSKKMLDEVHQVYFSDKKNLSRKNRLDFIEIAYNMLYLYFIKYAAPSHVAFSAKDGVDTTSTTLSSFFAFLKSMKGDLEWKVEEEEFMMEMIYSSAFLVRERAPHLAKLNRMVSMLSVITSELELDKKKIQKSISTLFEDAFSYIDVKRYIP